ncbi:MAG: Na+/H+ antiporter NhaC family protein [Endozoicomonadaceae bacterium]|nr:Na+/H+ antiporter NhaC family protein [Endozoicomonadaceae bacterium]
MELVNFEFSPLSFVAPVVAISLTVITRKVLLSLTVGILCGALLLTSFDPLFFLEYVSSTFLKVFWDDGLNCRNVFILLFLIMLGVMTSFITLAGGTRAFGEWACKRIHTRKGAQLLTVTLGIIIFIDDYFNSLAVGSISRPLSDKNGVSRAKLAYLLDSSAAPVCVIVPISSWGASIIGLIGSVMIAHDVTNITPLSAFVIMAPMNLYAVFALALAVMTAWLDLNVGPMKRQEMMALAGHPYDPAKGDPPGANAVTESEKGTVNDLVIPIAVLVIATIFSILWTGAQAQADAGQAFTVMGALETTDVTTSLVMGGFVGLLVAIGMLLRHKLSTEMMGKALVSGVKSMLEAIYILVLAWVLVDVINNMGTGKYLTGLVGGAIHTSMIPALLFVISGIIAFATGTSWGVFGIMLPIAGDMAASTDIAQLLPVMSAVLAGAVFGDHCSPISDTTILSSAGASCHHIDHVMTQLPYSAGVALVALLGYVVMGVTESASLGFLASLLAFIVLVICFKKMSPDLSDGARQLDKLRH